MGKNPERSAHIRKRKIRALESEQGRARSRLGHRSAREDVQGNRGAAGGGSELGHDTVKEKPGRKSQRPSREMEATREIEAGRKRETRPWASSDGEHAREEKNRARDARDNRGELHAFSREEDARWKINTKHRRRHGDKHRRQDFSENGGGTKKICVR